MWCAAAYGACRWSSPSRSSPTGAMWGSWCVWWSGRPCRSGCANGRCGRSDWWTRPRVACTAWLRTRCICTRSGRWTRCSTSSARSRGSSSSAWTRFTRGPWPWAAAGSRRRMARFRSPRPRRPFCWKASSWRGVEAGAARWKGKAPRRREPGSCASWRPARRPGAGAPCKARGGRWGGGQRNPAHSPNALRVLLAERAAEAGRVTLVATDLDDMSPEYVEPLRQALVAAGALDVQTWPVQMKKGRSGFRVEVVAPEELGEAVTAALFRHSTTAGVRRWVAERATLARRQVTVELAPQVAVRVKVLEQPDADGVRVKPEYEDVLAAARALGRPPLEVARVAQRDAEALVAKSKE